MINIEDIRKEYAGFQLQLSLQIPRGVVSGIVGRNGVGKSTLIKLILGLISADEGQIRTFGHDPLFLTKEDKEKIGVAMSDSGFSTYLCINDICRILKKMYRYFDETNFRKQCQFGGLPFNKRIGEFSTGMRAKLKVLIACSHQAELLILDEPTAGLDVVARNEVLALLRAYLSEDNNRSMLISSHISSDLESICDDVYLLNHGQIILHEDTDRILAEYVVLKLTKKQFQTIDQRYFLKVREESFGYSCLSNQKQYYLDNYPDVLMESGSIDEMIMIMSEE